MKKIDVEAIAFVACELTERAYENNNKADYDKSEALVKALMQDYNFPNWKIFCGYKWHDVTYLMENIKEEASIVDIEHVERALQWLALQTWKPLNSSAMFIPFDFAGSTCYGNKPSDEHCLKDKCPYIKESGNMNDRQCNKCWVEAAMTATIK